MSIGFTLLAVSLVLLGVIFGLSTLRNQKETQASRAHRDGARAVLREQMRALARRYDLTLTHVGAHGRSAIGYAQASDMLVVLEAAWSKNVEPDIDAVSVRTFSGAELVDVGVVEHTWVQTNKSGGSPQPFVRSVDLKILVDDRSSAALLVSFAEEDVSLGSSAHRDLLRQAYRWEGLVQALSRSTTTGRSAAPRAPAAAPAARDPRAAAPEPQAALGWDDQPEAAAFAEPDTDPGVDTEAVRKEKLRRRAEQILARRGRSIDEVSMGERQVRSDTIKA